MKKLKIVLVFLGLSFILAGCSNFLQGSDLKGQLDTIIEYEKRADFSISINASEGEGITTPAGSYSGKVNEPHPLQFFEAADYKFIRWQILDSNNNEVTNKISIDDPFSIRTSFTVLEGCKDLKIVPLCFLKTEKNRPEFKNFKIYKTNQNGQKINELSDKEFSQWTEPVSRDSDRYFITEGTEYSTNYVKSLWIECDASDVGSGIYALQIKETLYKDDHLSNSETVIKTNILNFQSGADSTSYTKNFLYEFPSQAVGKTSLEFSLIDYAGNVSAQSKKYYVIKDNMGPALLLSNNVFLYDFQAKDPSYSRSVKTSIPEIEENIKRIVIAFDDAKLYNYYENPKTIDLTLKYKNYNYKLNDLNLYSETSDYNLFGKYYYIDLDLPENEDSFLELTAVDCLGNETTVSGTVLKAPSIVSYSTVCNSETKRGHFSINTDVSDDIHFLNILRSIDATESLTDNSEFDFYHKVNKEWNGSVSRYYADCYQQLSQTWYYISDVDMSRNYTYYASGVYEQNIPHKVGYAYLVGHISKPVSFADSGMADDTFDVPLCNIEIIPLEKNSSLTKLKVNFSSAATLKNLDAVYFVYDSGSSRIKNLNTDFTIEIPTENFNTDTFKIVYLKDGKKREITSLDDTLLKFKGSKVDNVPPKFIDDEYLLPDCMGQLYYLCPPSDDDGFKKNGDGYGEAEIIFIPDIENLKYSHLSKVQELNWNIADWTNNYSKTLRFKGGKYYSIPISDIPDGDYIVMGSAEDINGNKSFYPISRYSTRTLDKPKITDAAGSVLTFSTSAENGAYYMYYEVFDPSTSKWIPAEYGDDSYTSEMNLDLDKGLEDSLDRRYIYEKDLLRTDKEAWCTVNVSKSSMIRLVIRHSIEYHNYGVGTCSWSYQNILALYTNYDFSYPIYCYSKYNNAIESAQVVLEGLGGYFVKHNYPFYVHTVYSEKDWGENPDVWEKSVMNENKINPKFYDATAGILSESIFKPDYSEVPLDSYYTTIFHFADGTSLMTPVARKN